MQKLRMNCCVRHALVHCGTSHRSAKASRYRAVWAATCFGTVLPEVQVMITGSTCDIGHFVRFAKLVGYLQAKNLRQHGTRRAGARCVVHLQGCGVAGRDAVSHCRVGAGSGQMLPSGTVCACRVGGGGSAWCNYCMAALSEHGRTGYRLFLFLGSEVCSRPCRCS